jgi:glycosyltransferase involved in cell wall biosynthesis
MKLSIIIAVYNTATYLKTCIDSVLNQSFKDFELLLCDNRSTDGSSDILKQYAKSDSRVKYLLTDRHIKASENRQFGFTYAQGEFITFVDSDDSVKPGIYARLFKEQSKHSADIVACNYDLVYSDRVTSAYSPMKDEVIDIQEVGYPHYFTKYFCSERPNNYLWSRIIRRSLAVENKIIFPPVDISEDTIFSMFCTCRAKTVVHISDSYYNYFQRDDSTMRRTIRSKNIAESYVYAFNCVAHYVIENGLEDVFADILPSYAATRVRSILFYIKLAGTDDKDKATESLVTALRDSSMLHYLRRAVKEEKIEDASLLGTIQNVLETMQ